MKYLIAGFITFIVAIMSYIIINFVLIGYCGFSEVQAYGFMILFYLIYTDICKDITDEN